MDHIDCDGPAAIARDRAIRHGRKSRSRPFTGYTRHIVKRVAPDLIVKAIARPANEAEHATLATLTTEVARHGALARLKQAA